jgi:hypothetical protein
LCGAGDIREEGKEERKIEREEEGQVARENVYFTYPFVLNGMEK